MDKIVHTPNFLFNGGHGLQFAGTAKLLDNVVLVDAFIGQRNGAATVADIAPHFCVEGVEIQGAFGIPHIIENGCGGLVGQGGTDGIEHDLVGKAVILPGTPPGDAGAPDLGAVLNVLNAEPGVVGTDEGIGSQVFLGLMIEIIFIID